MYILVSLSHPWLLEYKLTLHAIILCMLWLHIILLMWSSWVVLSSHVNILRIRLYTFLCTLILREFQKKTDVNLKILLSLFYNNSGNIYLYFTTNYHRSYVNIYNNLHIKAFGTCYSNTKNEHYRMYRCLQLNIISHMYIILLINACQYIK